MALTDNLVAYYKLDETSGTSIKDEITSSNGTLTNASQSSSGKLNYCTTFGGQGYYATCPSISSSISSSNAFSISVWVYNTKTSDLSVICGERQQSGSYYLNFLLSIDISSSNKVRIQTYGADSGGGVNLDSTSGISNSTRTHICAVFDGANDLVKLYINGEYNNQATQTSNMSYNSSSNLMIGRNSPLASQQDFAGRIDELGVWSRALSAAEVSTLYNSGNGIEYPFSTGSTFIPKIIMF